MDINLFPLQPPAEIGDYDNLLSDRVVSIAQFGYPGRIRIEVFTHRPWRSRSIVFEKVKSRFITLPERQAWHPELCRLHSIQRVSIRARASTRGIVREAA